MLGRHHARHHTSPGRVLRALVPALVVMAASVLLLGSATADAASRAAPRRDHGRGHWFKHTCAVAPRGSASCNAQVVTNAGGTPLATTAPPAGALGPGQFARAYALPTATPSGATIAIVDAYDNPNIESDLAAFSSYYGLPACTTANGCFRKVNQSGGTTLPSKNTGWGLEIALDVETAHGICQTCKILLVEASSPSYANLGAAENQAVKLGANVIANSWGGAESAAEISYDAAYFNHPGVVITASTGDSGYGVQYPASSPYVVAVGGTTLSLNADQSYKGETAWRDGGSGCSAYEAKPAFQSGLGCARRTVADVSADADPNTGAAIYDTYGYGGWVMVGGTSLSAPLIAGVYALSGNTSNGAAPYANPGALHDVKTGSNGTCSPASLCTAGAGYDGPTGLGSPNGIAAFGGVAPPPPAPDFALAVSPPSQTVTQGQSASYTVTMTPNASFGASSVSVTGSAVPSDLAFSGCSTPLTAASPTCTLTASTSGASAISHALTISGAGSGTLPLRSASATLVVQAPLAPDFALAVSPATQSAVQGQPASYTVTMTPNATFAAGDSVAISAASTPADLGFSGCASPLTAASPTLHAQRIDCRRSGGEPRARHHRNGKRRPAGPRRERDPRRAGAAGSRFRLRRLALDPDRDAGTAGELHGDDHAERDVRERERHRCRGRRPRGSGDHRLREPAHGNEPELHAQRRDDGCLGGESQPGDHGHRKRRSADALGRCDAPRAGAPGRRLLAVALAGEPHPVHAELDHLHGHRQPAQRLQRAGRAERLRAAEHLHLDVLGEPDGHDVDPDDHGPEDGLQQHPLHGDRDEQRCDAHPERIADRLLAASTMRKRSAERENRRIPRIGCEGRGSNPPVSIPRPS